MISTVPIKKDKLKELDYMRFIACFAVMIVHITATGVTDYIHGSLPHIIILLINRSLKFTTPIFIFLSGITSFYGYRNKEFKYFEFLRKRLSKVLTAYFIWCIVYYIIYIKLGYYGFDISFFIKNVLQGTMSYHLYFIIIITQLYILGPIFYFLIKNNKKRILVLLISSILTALSVRYLNFELSDRIFLKYMFFYMLGIYFTFEYEKIIDWLKRFRLIGIIGYMFSCLIYTYVSFYNISVYAYVWFVFSTVSIFFVYIVGLFFNEKLIKLYSFIKLFGQSSYYIYLMHPLILTLMIIFAANNGILSVTKRIVLYTVVVIPVTVISCLIYTLVKNKIKSILKKKEVSVVSN